MLTRKREWFALTAGMLLALTGMSKLISAGGNARILDIGDPVFQLPFRHLLLLVGALELLIAWQCLFRQERLFSIGLVAWLSTTFAVYRLGLWYLGWQEGCQCLGQLTDALHLSAHASDGITKALLAFLLIGSYIKLGVHWRKDRVACPKALEIDQQHPAP